MTSRSSTAAPILAVLAVGLVTLVIYVGAYFGTGEYAYSRQHIFREFPYAWQATTFWPAGVVEGWLRRAPVHIDSRHHWGARRIPADNNTPVRPISDEELDWIVQQWADAEGVDVDAEWEEIKAAAAVEDDES
jgi:hypothetical protein